MDVTFRESVPFYGERTNLSELFADLDSLDKSVIHKEDEKGNENESRFITGSIPYPVDKPASTSGGTKPNEERNLQVYTRRRSRTKKMSVGGTTTNT
jgi:hypothetical protein